MPYSARTFDSELELYFRQVRHDCVLDIGPGEGKYGKMLRRLRPETKLIGIKIDAAYVDDYKLREIYDEVRIGDAAELMSDPDCAFDAVIIGDAIEHMRKSIGLDLLNFIV